jgi:hypothetical protein
VHNRLEIPESGSFYIQAIAKYQISKLKGLMDQKQKTQNGRRILLQAVFTRQAANAHGLLPTLHNIHDNWSSFDLDQSSMHEDIHNLGTPHKRNSGFASKTT